MKSDSVYLHHIVDAIERISGYISGLSPKDFVKDEKTKDAVVRNLEIIGEAAKKITEKTKSSHPKIPWKHMASMRDRLIHAYFGVDYNIVWQVAKEELPPLREKLKSLLK